MDSNPEAANEPPAAKAAAEERCNWAELPADVLSVVFRKLGALEVLLCAQWVCRPWKKVSHEPQLWHVVEMRCHPTMFTVTDTEEVAREAVDRAAGQLQEYHGKYCGSDDLLRYIAERTSVLKCLRLVSCYDVSDEGLTEFVSRSHLLEELEITFSSISAGVYETVGQLCPQLKLFRLNKLWTGYTFCEVDSNFEINCDVEALAIANSMQELCLVQLIGNQLSNKGLLAILENCPHLESLDIRRCCNIKMDKSLESRMAGIRNVRLPKDSIADCEFVAQPKEVTAGYLSDLPEIALICNDMDEYDDFHDCEFVAQPKEFTGGCLSGLPEIALISDDIWKNMMIFYDGSDDGDDCLDFPL